LIDGFEVKPASGGRRTIGDLRAKYLCVARGINCADAEASIVPKANVERSKDKIDQCKELGGSHSYSWALRSSPQ
jgi:hypothetical protein